MTFITQHVGHRHKSFVFLYTITVRNNLILNFKFILKYLTSNIMKSPFLVYVEQKSGQSLITIANTICTQHQLYMSSLLHSAVAICKYAKCNFVSSLVVDSSSSASLASAGTLHLFITKLAFVWKFSCLLC